MGKNKNLKFGKDTVSRKGRIWRFCRRVLIGSNIQKSQKEMKRLVLEANDWVNIVATTPCNEIVVVRQYRFGNEKLLRKFLVVWLTTVRIPEQQRFVN